MTKEINIEKWVDEKVKILEGLAGLKKVRKLENQAIKALDEACSIIDGLGISYDFSISPLRQTYGVNKSESKLYQEFKAELVGATVDGENDALTEDDADEILSDYLYESFNDGEWGSAGWQHSAVC